MGNECVGDDQTNVLPAELCNSVGSEQKIAGDKCELSISIVADKIAVKCAKIEESETDGRTTHEKHFRIVSKTGSARHGFLRLSHGVVETPVFMPVGTQGTMKGLTPEGLLDDGCQILLANTYHLGHRPSDNLVRRAGGLHQMMAWSRSILTDSGGFQMVSLGNLMEVTEEGVLFQSPHTSELMLLTPERCIQMQENIGSDIAMQLDHVIPTLTEGRLVKEAMLRSIRWLDRCLSAKTLSDERQALFPIVQGGLDLDLREHCVLEMVSRARIGIAIGGLSGGESKDDFWRVVSRCCELIPEHLPRYVMGVGWPVDLVVASVLGADMFDCVWPTRTARFGTAIVRRGGELRLKLSRFRADPLPIDSDCGCTTCQAGYSRAFLHSAIQTETIGCHLISAHNIHHQLDLMRRFRLSVDEDRLHVFLTQFLRDQFRSRERIPGWVCDALAHAGFADSLSAVPSLGGEQLPQDDDDDCPAAVGDG